MTRLLQKFSVLCLLAMISMASWADIVEKTVYSTKFQEWTDVSSKTTEQTVAKTTTDGQELNFYLMETSCDNDGTNAKFTSECITPGYLMAAKTATPYIKTSALKSVTTVKFVHAATGGNRGWGLKVKGDGDDDWITLSSAVANPAAGQEVTVEVNRTNVQLWFYNLNSSQNAYMTSLEIKGNVEVASRTFTDFKIDFRQKTSDDMPYTLVAPETGMPEGITLNAGTWHDAQHGTSGATVTVPVDGPVKFTIGGCQYGNGATVSIDGGEAIAIDTKAAGCDNGFGTYNKYATYTYNVEQAATLTFNLGNYCPYFFAEKCDFVPSVTVTYYNTDGTKIGEEVVDGGSKLAFKAEYAAKINVPEGSAFRGWFVSKATTATKAVEGVALTEDTKLYAKVTDIEDAVVGTHFVWDLTKNYFYDEDHEAISMVGGTFHDGTHGWTVAKTNSVKIAVGGKAAVSIKNCKYSASQTATVTNMAGDQIANLDFVAGGTDGEVWSFKYNGTTPDTLTITYPQGAYIHGVEVYNVANFVEKDAAGFYEVASGDAASLMMLLATAQKGDKIYLPNGTYDLGTTCLTTVPSGVSIIGQSQDGVIIRNTPLEEGIGVTATLLFTGNDIYLQDLSLQCSSEKCATPSASRCVTIQDKGTRNICKNVSLLSGQDTYYSNGSYTQRAYFEDCYITGTVDYLCGGGDVVFNRVKHYVLDRSSANVIVAANTDAKTKWGYVLLNNTIDCADSQVGKYNFGRPWNNSPAATWINAKMLKKGSDAGYTSMTANLTIRYHEYNTQDPDGNVVTSHNLDACKGASTSDAVYLSEDKAAEYTIANVFAAGIYDNIAAWDPEADTKQVTSIPAEGIFLLEDGTITTTAPTSGKVRVANARGGFGPEINLSSDVKVKGDVTEESVKPAEGVTTEEAQAAVKSVIAPSAAVSSVETGLATAVDASKVSFEKEVDPATVSYSLNVVYNAATIANESDAAVVTAMTFEVSPQASATGIDGNTYTSKVSNDALTGTVTFRLPVDKNADYTLANIMHESKSMGQQPVVTTEDGEKYIELKVTSFSKYSYELTNPIPAAINNVDANVESNKTGKFLENGQIVIYKAGKKFNVAGAQMK